MAIDITVPELGESVVEATVGRWLKRPGEPVTAGEPVVELETDKVNMEVRAPQAGTLQQILKDEGATVAIGEVLATLGEGAGNGQNQGPATEKQPEPSPADGYGSGDAPPDPDPDLVQEEEQASGRATPLARRIAAEHGVDINRIAGTGPGGRVRREDVDAFLRQRERVAVPGRETGAPSALTAPSPPIQQPASPIPAFLFPAGEEVGRREERVRMTRRRQTIARHLTEALQTAAMLTTFNEVDMTKVMDLRTRHKESFKERNGVNLGFMSFFTKAVVGALKAFPLLNSEIQGDEIVIKHYYDIGIAVGTDEGLVVPVVRDADRLTFAQIEKQIAELAQKARNGSLSLAELQGGTFTITNGGIYGSLMSTPIINYPQVGILGMHKIMERPVVENGQIVARPMMYLALSYDHRIVDGSEAVRFLVTVKNFIEDPENLLLGG